MGYPDPDGALAVVDREGGGPGNSAVVLGNADEGRESVVPGPLAEVYIVGRRL